MSISTSIIPSQVDSTLLIPSGNIAITFFTEACPTGWSEYTALRGRYPVGVPAGGDIASTVGTALSNDEDRQTGQHTHTFSGSEMGTHTHSFSGSGMGTHNHTQDSHAHSQSTWSNSGLGSVFARGVSGNPSTISPGPSTATNQASSAGTPAGTNAASTAGSPAGTNANTGSVASTNAPYIQLVPCTKD